MLRGRCEAAAAAAPAAGCVSDANGCANFEAAPAVSGFAADVSADGRHGEVGLRCVAGGFTFDSGRRGCRG